MTITVPQKEPENIPYCEIAIAEKYYKNLMEMNPGDSNGNNLIDLGASELKQFYDTQTFSLMGYQDFNTEKIEMQHYLDYNCSLYWANKVLTKNVSTETCPPTCETLEYHGKIVKAKICLTGIHRIDIVSRCFEINKNNICETNFF